MKILKRMTSVSVTTEMLTLILLTLFSQKITSVTGDAAIVTNLESEDKLLKPGYPGYKQPHFSLSPRLPEPRSLFYRQTPGVEKFRSPVHELYMRPYNYVSYSMGGSKPVAYNYHYQTPNTLPEPSYPAPYQPRPYTPAPSYHVTPVPHHSPSIPHHSPSLPPLRYSTPAPVTYPPPQYQPQPIIVSTPKPLPSPPSYSSFPKANHVHMAVAVVKGDGISGTITFSQTGGPTGQVKVRGKIEGLAPGLHGFHIHQLGDMTNGCKSMKGHFNPLQVSHGAPGDKSRHVGDLGNIEADMSGVATIDMVDTWLSLNGINSILGRGVVIHAGRDDLGQGGDDGSLKTGNAGGRVACAVIGLTESAAV